MSLNSDSKGGRGVRSPKALRTYLRRLADERRSGDGGHPPVEQLVDYHERELSSEVAEEVRDHLALCGDCTRLVLDLARFAELEAPGPEHALSGDDVAEEQLAFEVRLDGERRRGR